MTEITAAMVKELRERTGAAMMSCKKALDESKGDMEAAVDVLRKGGEAKAAKRSGKVAAEGKVVLATSEDNKVAFIVEVNSETDFVARDSNFVEFVQTIAECGLAQKVTEVDALLALPLEGKGGQTVEQVRQDLINKLGENIKVRRVALLQSDGIVGSYCHGGRIGVLVALDKDNAELAKDIAMHVAALKPQALSPDDLSNDLIEREKDIFSAQAKESGKPDDIVAKMVAGRLKKFLKEVSLVGQPFVKDPNQTVAELLKANSAEVKAFVRFEVGEGIEKESQNFADEVMAQVQGND